VLRFGGRHDRHFCPVALGPKIDAKKVSPIFLQHCVLIGEAKIFQYFDQKGVRKRRDLMFEYLEQKWFVFWERDRGGIHVCV
jgi:hypothetical protein